MNLITIINKLLTKKKLTQAEAKFIYTELLNGKLDDIEITSLLLNGLYNGITEFELTGALQALKAAALKIKLADGQVLDCCGTGGDNSKLVNISSISAIVAVCAGLKVAKHGNRNVSSQCGSSDLYKQLGLNIDMTPLAAKKLFNLCGFTYLHAPNYHQGIKHVMKVRNKLKVRTIFNLMGPLLNPAEPKYQLIGVYDDTKLDLITNTLLQFNVNRAWIINNSHADEILPLGSTKVNEIHAGNVRKFKLTAADFGFSEINLANLAGNSPEFNANAALELFAGKANADLNHTIAANVAAMFKITGNPKSLAELSSDLLALIKSGKCTETWNKITRNAR